MSNALVAPNLDREGALDDPDYRDRYERENYLLQEFHITIRRLSNTR
jgi:hypothetical protein